MWGPTLGRMAVRESRGPRRYAVASREYFSSVFFIAKFSSIFFRGSTLYFTAIADTAVAYGKVLYWHMGHGHMGHAIVDKVLS